MHVTRLRLRLSIHCFPRLANAPFWEASPIESVSINTAVVLEAIAAANIPRASDASLAHPMRRKPTTVAKATTPAMNPVKCHGLGPAWSAV